MKFAIRPFGGMLPIMDERLLPDSNGQEAVNTWLYAGSLLGMRTPQRIVTVAPTTRAVFRVPKGSSAIAFVEESWWLEFEWPNTTVVRSPVQDVDDPRFYWADGIHPPGYTTRSRLQAGLPPLRLGIPKPEVAPGLSAGGGSGSLESRSYVYTWASAYHEEGPPSDPSAIVEAPDDTTWALTFTAPTAADLLDRDLAFTRIYRTVTAADGTAQFYFVAEIPISQLTYNDVVPNATVVFQGQLQSLYWTAPPDDLEGLCSLPNGMIAGWRGPELWYCEPFRPHAWPAPYQTSVDFEIVGMAAYGQSLIIGTVNQAYTASGVHPSSVTTAIITGSEPCHSQGSFAVLPDGVLYAGQNGLMLCTPAGATNVTRGFISTDKWHQLLNLTQLHAAIMNGAYYCYGGAAEPAFQADAFQADAFQIDVSGQNADGALIELKDQRIAYSILREASPVWNVIQDVWTAEVFLLMGDGVYLHSLTDGERRSFDWTSKTFQLTKPDNMAAMKIVCRPGEAAVQAAGTMEWYVNGVLKFSRPLPVGNKAFRLKTGYKADSFSVRIVGSNLHIDQIEVASTMHELAEI